MDTRFWGPSGWKLLHLIPFADESISNRKSICEFFEVLPYILPCKFCRASLSVYMKELPVSCKSPLALQKWIWQIHNKVNGKLRSQGLAADPDPPFLSVQKMYLEKYKQGCSRTTFDGWEFLFSVAENHPLSQSGKGSLPMPDAPPEETITDPLERNRWNVMTSEERMPYYEKFWTLLPQVLPFTTWQTGWKRVPRKVWSTRKEAMQTLWKIRCALEKEMELLNRTSYSSLCKVLQNHRSGCQKSNRSKTCRKKRGRRTTLYSK